MEKAFDREVERSIFVDDVEISGEIEALNLDIDIDPAQGITDEVGKARRKEWVRINRKVM